MSGGGFIVRASPVVYMGVAKELFCSALLRGHQKKDSSAQSLPGVPVSGR